MKSLQGLRITRRGESVLVLLLLAACVAGVVAIALNVESDICQRALETGTQWRIDRACGAR